MKSLLLLGLMKSPVVRSGTGVHHLIDVGNWTAIALEIKTDQASKEEEVLGWAKAQNVILAGYAATRDVLPVALGSVFSGESALIDFIVAEDISLKAEADRLAGLCEYSLHIDDLGSPLLPKSKEPEPSGRNFLRQKKMKHGIKALRSHERIDFVGAILTALRADCVDVLSFESKQTERLASFTLLIRRDRAEALISALDQMGENATALHLDCRLVGPSPAYSFAGKELAVV